MFLSSLYIITRQIKWLLLLLSLLLNFSTLSLRYNRAPKPNILRIMKPKTEPKIDLLSVRPNKKGKFGGLNLFRMRWDFTRVLIICILTGKRYAFNNFQKREYLLNNPNIVLALAVNKTKSVTYCGIIYVFITFCNPLALITLCLLLSYITV